MKFAPEIERLNGYTPGEQPRDVSQWIKLNTNENPYPPSPACEKVLQTFDVDQLRRYPNACSDALREAIARFWGYKRENVIIGNGSDDILNMLMRVFAGPQGTVGVLSPGYSLYPVLAAMQNADVVPLALNDDFSIPNSGLDALQTCNVVFIASPNAPTGLAAAPETLRRICRELSNSAVVIDEAYADFADFNAMTFPAEFDNVIISRTFSKSYSLAGARAGYAVAHADVIEQMMKVKDSYNVNALTQAIALAAFNDHEYLQKNVALIRAERERSACALLEMGFKVIPSQSNFLFVSPPDGNGKACYEYLKSKKILVRYFDYPDTCRYVRITIGTPENMDALLLALAER